MQVILLERIEKLGQMGDVVTVRSGYARNFLLPQEKALRATKENITFFETQKKQLEADNLKRKGEAEKIAKKLDGMVVAVIRQASEGGQLYGSVNTKDIASAVTEAGITIIRKQVHLDRSFKMLGLYPVKIVLHPEVSVFITMNIARSDEEAKIQEERGEALISTDEEEGLADVAVKAVEAEETNSEDKEEAASEEASDAEVAEAAEDKKSA